MYSDDHDDNKDAAEKGQMSAAVRKSGNVQVLRTVVEERESRSTSSSVSSQATERQISKRARTSTSAVRSLKEKAKREVQVSVSRDSRAVRESKSVKFHRKERRRRSFQGHPYEDLFNNLLATDRNDLHNSRIRRRASIASGRPAIMEGRGRQSPSSFSDRSSPSNAIIRGVLAQAAGRRLKKVQKKIERAKTPTLPEGDEHRYHSGISDYEEAERSLALSDRDGPASLRSLRAGTPPLLGSRPSSGRIPQIRRDTDEESGREGDESVPRSAASTPRGEITGSIKELSVTFSKKSPQGSRALRIEKERLESELRKEKAELSNMRFEREMLLEREKQYGKNIQDLQNRVSQLLTQQDRLQKEHGTELGRFQSKALRTKESPKKVKTLEDELTNSRAAAGLQSENIQDLQNRVSQLLTQQDRLQKEHGTELGRFQSKALADVEREKKDAAQRARILEGELDALKVENASLEKQLRVAKTTSALARDSDRTGRERHQSELRTMQDEIRRTHQLLAEQEKVVEENNKKSAQMHEKFSKAREQKTQLERDLENSKSVAEQRIKTLEGRSKVAEENLELARTEHSEELAKTREELISQVMQLQTKQSELSRLLTIEREKTKSLQSTVRHLEDRMERQRSSSRSSGFAGSEATESEREEIEESLRSQIEELQYQKDELEAQLDELREEFENKVFNETKELQKTFSEKVATLLKENEESHKKVKTLEDELTNSRTAAGLQSGENRKLLARLHEADSQINKLRENLEKSEAQTNVKEQEKSHVLHEKSQQQSEISRLKAKITTQEALIKTAEDGREKVENEWKKTMEDLKATDSVRIELERLKSQLKELDNEYQESCQERTEMAKKLEVSAKEAESLRARVDSLLSDLEQMDSKKAGLLEEIGARDRKMDALLAQYRALEDQLQRDRRDLLSEQDLSQRLMGQLAELQQKYQMDAEARTGDFEEQNAKLLQDNYKLLNTIELKESELEESSRLLKEELEESENRATEKEKMLSAAKRDVEKFRGKAEEKDRTISRLEDELHNKEKQQLLLENQLQATKGRIEQMEENERQSATSLKVIGYN
ncbi:Hypp1524 [Branchiostoma lanceolatum]|uniref:Hypp1524 protein n=1 Tax=Branchiostoma lanceolatum TaxID=7740 RepID=A0A8K0EP85_BRALA|nr:Hypp1524 [Branchiostoma lanceolatum]